MKVSSFPIAGIVVLIVSNAWFGSASAVEIENFKFGVVCTDDRTFAWVCFETDEIQISGQGRCIYDGEELPCTWYGYQFDYSGAESGAILQCEISINAPTTLGNPAGVVSVDATSFAFEIELNEGEGHIYEGQYSIFSVNAAPREDVTVCTHQGKEVFRYRARYVYPTLEAGSDVSLR